MDAIRLTLGRFLFAGIALAAVAVLAVPDSPPMNRYASACLQKRHNSDIRYELWRIEQELAEIDRRVVKAIHELEVAQANVDAARGHRPRVIRDPRRF